MKFGDLVLSVLQDTKEIKCTEYVQDIYSYLREEEESDKANPEYALDQTEIKKLLDAQKKFWTLKKIIGRPFSFFQSYLLHKQGDLP